MAITDMKEKYLNADGKTKALLFLGIVLIATTLPKGLIFPLGVLALILMFSQNLWSGFSHVFMTLLRFALGAVLVLLSLYAIMIVVVYFFT